MIIAATGHRPHKLGNEYDGQGPYTEFLKDKFYNILYQYQPVRIISGMALGVDIIWAACGIAMGIPLTAAIPFEGQQARWPDRSQDIYYNILFHELTLKEYVCAPGYAAWKMQKRNEWMVDNADVLVGVWDGSTGGTYNCIEYARHKGIKIIYIDPKELIL